MDYQDLFLYFGAMSPEQVQLVIKEKQRKHDESKKLAKKINPNFLDEPLF